MDPGSKKIKIIKIILVILTILGIGATIYFSWLIYTQIKYDGGQITIHKSNDNQSNKNNNQDSNENIDNCPSQLTSIDKTTIASWNNYTNEKYHYSLKHPANWTIQKLDTQDDDVMTTFYFPIEGQDVSVMFQVVAGEKVDRVIADDFTLESQKNITVDCLEAIYYYYLKDGIDPSGYTFKSNRVSFTKNNTKYLVFILYPAADPSDFEEKFDLILKTINFE